jgi:hypothetical protein
MRMSRPTDDAGGDPEYTVSPDGASLRERMREFIADTGDDVNLKTARQIETDSEDLSTIVIDGRDERV